MDVTFGKSLFSTTGKSCFPVIWFSLFDMQLVTGEAHRRQRKMMNPVFSIAHMRGLSKL
jgi:cytochrome P450